MLSIESTGSFKNTEDFLKRLSKGDIFASLERYGAEGVAALSRATPVESSRTASSWTYEVRRTSRSYSIVWKTLMLSLVRQLLFCCSTVMAQAQEATCKVVILSTPQLDLYLIGLPPRCGRRLPNE